MVAVQGQLAKVNDDETIMHCQHEKQLSDVLNSWNFQRIEMEGDGNCLFLAIAWNLMLRIQACDHNVISMLSSLGVDTNNVNISSLRDFLRKILVSQWMSNPEYYQSFVTIDILSEAHILLQSGHFEGELGDLMVLTLLNIPIVIFTSAANMPVLCATPAGSMPSATSVPLFITLTQSGAGHYDCSVPVDPPESKQKIIKCTCGQKRDFNGLACSTLRCTCL